MVMPSSVFLSYEIDLTVIRFGQFSYTKAREKMRISRGGRVYIGSVAAGRIRERRVRTERGDR